MKLLFEQKKIETIGVEVPSPFHIRYKIGQIERFVRIEEKNGEPYFTEVDISGSIPYSCLVQQLFETFYSAIPADVIEITSAEFSDAVNEYLKQIESVLCRIELEQNREIIEKAVRESKNDFLTSGTGSVPPFGIKTEPEKPGYIRPRVTSVFDRTEK